MQEYWLLNELNELAGENVVRTTSRNCLPALLTRAGKNSVRYMRPHRFLLFQFSLVLLSGTSNLMENQSFSKLLLNTVLLSIVA